MPSRWSGTASVCELLGLDAGKWRSVRGCAGSLGALGVLGYRVASSRGEALQMNHRRARASVVGIDQPLSRTFPTRAISRCGTARDGDGRQSDQR